MKQRAELISLFTRHAPEVKYDLADGKSLVDSAATTILITTQAIALAFPFLWKIFIEWLGHHKNGKVIIKYRGREGEEIVVEYTKLSKKEVEEFVHSTQGESKTEVVRIDFIGD